MKKYFIFFLIMVFLFFLIGKIPAENQETDKYLVSLEKSDKTITGADAETEKIRDIIDIIDKEKIQRYYENSASVYLTDKEADYLQNIKGLKVEKIERRELFLQDSVDLVNSTISWPLNYKNFNLTGKGVSVCIIDTGVYYTHSDLGGCYGNNNYGSNCKVVGGHDFVNNDNNPIDDNGHGTHAAGIIAANGSITGVAPEAKIIALKACSGLGCYDDDLNYSIYWCVENSSLFNISVISMSLGSGSYSTYCNDDSLNKAIQAAIRKNISVVIAAGNGENNTGTGYYDKIAAPACVQNATPISSTTKEDDIDTTYANRNSLLKLFAPGSVINSTKINGGYEIRNGTSMATPHAAGAIAILSQFLKLNNVNKTPMDIEDILNDTGKRIEDSESGLFYSRINIYSALLYLDDYSPNVSLISPANNFQSSNNNITLRCNASDLSLKNVSLYVWNSSGVYNITYKQISGSFYSYEFNLTGIPIGNYSWNCEFYDENGDKGDYSSNYTFSIFNIIVNLTYPANSLTTNQNKTYNCTANSSFFLSNATIYFWNSSLNLAYNFTQNVSGNYNESSFNYNFTYEDTYLWNCKFMDNQSYAIHATNNFSVTYDISSPVFYNVSPANGTWNNGFFNLTLNENSSCFYSFDGGMTNISMGSSDYLNFSAINSSFNQNELINVTFFCNDSAGNLNSSRILFWGDITAPNISLISPSDEYSETSSSAILRVYYNVSDDINISSCSLILNGTIYSTNSSIVNQTVNHSFLLALAPGKYNWSINCTDQTGNIGNSSTRRITISAPSSTSGDSSSGSGGGGNIAESVNLIPTFVGYNKLSLGYTRTFERQDKLSFEMKIGEAYENHSITLDYIGKDYANFSIRSELIKISLKVGESSKLNISSNEDYNLNVRLVELNSSAVIVEVKAINEKISGAITPDLDAQNKTISDDDADELLSEKARSPLFWIKIVVLSLSILVFILLILELLYRKYLNEKEKNEGDNKENKDEKGN